MEGIHGGDIYRNQVQLDFSVNVNPLGMPEGMEEALHRAVEHCGEYPDIRARRLQEAVSGMLKVPAEYLAFGSGASELFMAVVHALRPQRTVIPVPSFYGYEYAAEAAGGEILYYPLKEEKGFLPREDFRELLTGDVSLLFLANPNNPTGKLMPRPQLRELIRTCRDRGITVVLDECFIEFCGREYSMLPEIGDFDNLLLVRAFTKICSIPGVRLGYLVCSNPGLIERIRRQLPEWNLSVFAQAAGIVCAGQAAFISETAAYVEKERQLLARQLERPGLRVFPGEANFILIYSGKDLYGELLKRGILIRDCGNFRGLTKGYYRLAVKSRQDNERLWKAIGELF